ncbi:MAG: outer membrane protein transport protein [Xanthomonadales bacterium]|jgi:long-chain fatty acid transport protein|nr:outer membrane protein transport protein [Xanthomonadales bacterium]MDH3925245.1 outer membrane protein transport protein [Xanthomonadales bacterium]MDH3939404.1 outer membrane protein transport protein [Xanthomonadales bacterium]MDH4002376.1 outer membrane protein transport protein [Xanthomonadales bacterium]
MTKKFNWFTTAVVVTSLCAATSAYATNGYYTHGNGTKNKAMAGSGIALPEDAIDMANNPAVAPFVGDQLIVGAALFSPTRKYETGDSIFNGNFGAFTIGPNKIKSDNSVFVIPHIAKSWQLSNGNAWGLSFYGRGGMDTEWNGGTATFDHDLDGVPTTFEGTYGAGKAGVNLNQAFLDITWAKQVNDQFSFGVSAVLVAQTFKAFGVGNFAPYTETFAASGGTMMPDSLSNNGTDWSWGAGFKIGMHAPLSDKVSLGLMYQSKIWMNEFDDYSDLFAEQGDFDIPANLKFGVTFHASETLDLNFDIEQIWYSDVDSVANPIQNLFACPTAMQGGMDLSSCLGGDNGGGFGWDDMTVFKAGARWEVGEDWTWRFGYSYGKQPIDDDQMTFNILAPAVVQSHFTAGFTLERTPGRQFNMAVMYAPNKSQTGPQNFDGPPDLAQTVKWEMYQWEVEASYSWRF